MTDDFHPGDVMRLRDLARAGADRAAGAFGALVGRDFRPGVPMVRLLPAERAQEPFVAGASDAERRDMSGVFFEVEGGPGGVMALFFTPESANSVLEQLTGRPAKELDADTVDSALREVGNILSSHVVSAVADHIGAVVLPSVPMLATGDAPAAFASLVAMRALDHPALRIEIEIADGLRELRSLLVFVPDRIAEAIAPDPGV
ncbi:MAG: chemotaxis protein CheC [Myxococcota bacterium]|nr:chemotaxis protein CheC [Myxococcota bacterium]